MDNLRYISITMLILCSVICLILLICVLTAGHRNEKLDKIFIFALYCHIIMMLADAIGFALQGSNEPYAHSVLRVSSFTLYILGNALAMLFTLYILTVVKMKTMVSKKTVLVSHIALSSSIIAIVCAIISQFNGMVYFIDESNFFRTGSLYPFSIFLGFLCITLNTGIVLVYMRFFEKRARAFLLSYTVMPIIAVVTLVLVGSTVATFEVATTMTLLIFYAGIQNDIYQQLKQNEMNAKISVMLSQIQPHFLYNSLVAIRQLCRIDPKLAEETVVEFAGYLRGNLDSLTHNKPISFDRELNHLETYLAIEKKRFGELINIVYNIEVRDFVLPSLTLQPIVENAVRYGITKRDGGGIVTITTQASGNSVVITVIDNGIGFDLQQLTISEHNHVGIENVRSRLATMCGGTLSIHSIPDIGTTVTITIPNALHR